MKSSPPSPRENSRRGTRRWAGRSSSTGTRAERTGTLGCISMDDDAIRELYPKIGLGAEVGDRAVAAGEELTTACHAVAAGEGGRHRDSEVRRNKRSRSNHKGTKTRREEASCFSFRVLWNMFLHLFSSLPSGPLCPSGHPLSLQGRRVNT